MYDTIAASTPVQLLDERVFPMQQTITDGEKMPVVRMWRNPHPSKYEPRLTYWRNADGTNGRLRIEFSLSKMIGADPLINITTEQAQLALFKASQWLADVMLIIDAPPLFDWTIQRIDYAWNFAPSADVPQYITMLQGLWLGRMSRHPHPDSEGVIWKSRTANHRWVKFYNKSRQSGELLGLPVLRFEVSNFKQSLAYMAERWFGCGLTVGEFVQPGRALYVMARVWNDLKLNQPGYVSSSGAMLKLKALFGNGAPGAFYALMCISTYGSDCHKVHKLMSANSYYRWKRVLGEHGLLVTTDVSLPALHLPIAEALDDLLESSPQNLSNFPALHLNRDRNFSAIFWRRALGLAEKAPKIDWLFRRLAEFLELKHEETRDLSGGVGIARRSKPTNLIKSKAS